MQKHLEEKLSKGQDRRVNIIFYVFLMWYNPTLKDNIILELQKGPSFIYM